MDIITAIKLKLPDLNKQKEIDVLDWLLCERYPEFATIPSSTRQRIITIFVDLIIKDKS